jgi:endoglucanase
MPRYALTYVALLAGACAAQQTLYGQCGGIGWSGPTTCVDGAVCVRSGDYYSQCVPGTAASTTLATVTGSPASPTSSPGTSGKTKYAGMNIAGFDFGCDIQGNCKLSGVVPPITSGNNGPAQMQHFVRDDKLNAFRLPVGWQYLVNNNLGGTLDATNFANYDKLMQACLAVAELCILDVHNYARWNGQVVGQGGPTNAQLANLWTQLATKYKSQSKVAFGVMNEPHDLTVPTWADTVQAVVTAIRNTGAKSQMILMPGTDFTSAGSFVSSGSGPALLKVKNPDGTTNGLIMDVHRYLDSDNSGTHTECVTNNIDGSFAPLATWLRQNNRQAILSETGGGNTASCETDVCQQFAYLNKNADVYLGYIGWSAGSFAPSYELNLTPNGNTDTALAAMCFSRA